MGELHFVCSGTTNICNNTHSSLHSHMYTAISIYAVLIHLFHYTDDAHTLYVSKCENVVNTCAMSFKSGDGPTCILLIKDILSIEYQFEVPALAIPNILPEKCSMRQVVNYEIGHSN